MESSSSSPLDQPDFNVGEYFNNFIKTKKIDELISYDNKLFSEVRNLESEKHVLVTQNYKKFVSATETINTIKSSLVNFEKDLTNLQSKVQNLVSNFNTINSSIDSKLKQTEEIYKIKKDLKRLKFISDLPSVLSKQLNLYMNDNEKNLAILEKSLNYYQKCKDFLKLHKDNQLVKDIFERTSELIYKYSSIITDQMNIVDFNEFHLEKFEMCLSLLVKIEDNKEELIKIFLEKYQFLINNKLENLFAMKNGVDEIDYETYNKIYDNYEFAINENDFLIYEEQLKASQLNQGPQASGQSSLQSVNEIPNMNMRKFSTDEPIIIGISGLQSKSFKKGTFIWICKKVVEEINKKLLISSYESFGKLFGEEKLENINILYQTSLKNFYSKLTIFLKESNIKLDPIFFKEGLLSYLNCFKFDIFNKINPEKVNKAELITLILNNNKDLIQMYLTSNFGDYIQILCSEFNKSFNELIQKDKQQESSLISSLNPEQKVFFKKLNKNLYIDQITNLSKNILEITFKYSSIIRNIDLIKFNDNSILSTEIDQIYIKLLMFLFKGLSMIIESNNKLKFSCNNKGNQLEGGIDGLILQSEENIKFYKKIIMKEFYPISLEKIYFCIIFIKCLANQQNLKTLIEKLIMPHLELKNSKNYINEIKLYIESEILKLKGNLFDAIVLENDHKIFSNLKQIFFDVNFLIFESSPVTFRQELKQFLYELYQRKIELNEVLIEEMKNFNENKISLFSNESLNVKSTAKKSMIQIEMEKLQVRRISIYGEESESPQLIFYVLGKILLKTLNEFIKLKKFSSFAIQQMQIDLYFIKDFFKRNLIQIDVENIFDAFIDEILNNIKFNHFFILPKTEIARETGQGEQNENISTDFNDELLNEILKMHQEEFKNIPMMDPENNDNENLEKLENKIV